jgi:3-hydroxyisobutyryl-CoA hydrolase
LKFFVFQSGASPDFHTGVTSLLVQKLRTRPSWSPSTILETSIDSILAKFFDPNSQYLKNVPNTTFSRSAPQHSERDPMQWSLPTEQEIKRLVKGEHPISGGMAPTLSDLITQMRELRPKQGVEQKVRDVVSRKCHVEGGDGEGYIQWKS